MTARRSSGGSRSREAVIVDVVGGERNWSENLAVSRKPVEHETLGEYLARLPFARTSPMVFELVAA